MIVNIRNCCLLIPMTTLLACQSGGPSSDIELAVKQSPDKLMAVIARNVQKCWFKRANPKFNRFKMANELNSYAGRPRLLLVPKNNPTGLPTLVVQAQSKNNTTQLQAFGPLLATNAGKTISADLKNWTSGKTACVN